VESSVPVEVLATSERGVAGVNVGPAGRIFTSNWRTGKVLEIVGRGKLETRFSDLVRPRSLIWEGGTRLLVVADGIRQQPQRRGVLLRLDLADGSRTVLWDRLRRPRGLARTPDGTVVLTAGAIRQAGEDDDDDGGRGRR